MSFVITVDGPSGAGKGTVCRILAQKMGYSLLDSGAIYRIAALAALNKGLDLTKADALATLAASLDIRFDANETTTTVWLDGADVSRAIREEKTGMAASKVAALAGVRQALLERQRAFACGAGLVADGRDMGTVVFPSADVKIFLTASAEERAHRRELQLEQSGQKHFDASKILADIKERDDRDMNRATAPLVPAEDAIVIDSTALSIEQVVREIERHISACQK